MAGPTCAILLRNALNADDVGVLDRVLASVSSHREGQDFWVTDTRAIGGTYRGEGRPFLYAVESEDREEEELTQLVHALGWLPETAIVLAAMSNQQHDHSILAELAAALAEHFDGMIDLGGELPVPPEHGVVAIEYETISDRKARYMVLSPYALRRWREQSEFAMVK
jgi:hypothetical protein